MQTIRASSQRQILPPAIAALLPPELIQAILHLPVDTVEELRLHAGRMATVTYAGGDLSTGVVLNTAQLKALLLRLCDHSLYAHRDTICQGYISVAGGVRVGVCGCAAVENGQVIGVSEVSGLILRIPHAIHVPVAPLLSLFQEFQLLRGMLLYAPPGVGKTTLLCALTKAIAASRRTVAIDTRGELSAALSGSDLRLDVLSGYPLAVGLEIAVRCMGAQVATCDEIGNGQDAGAILSAANRGVPLIATAHADTISALLARNELRALHEAGVFGAYIGLRRAPGNSFLYQITRQSEVRLDRA